MSSVLREKQADTAVIQGILTGPYGLSDLGQHASVLIFPNLVAGDSCYRPLQRPGRAVAISHMLDSEAKFVHVVQKDDLESDIVTPASFSIVDAR